jgi:hypothetical protein
MTVMNAGSKLQSYKAPKLGLCKEEGVACDHFIGQVLAPLSSKRDFCRLRQLQPPAHVFHLELFYDCS